MEHFRHRKAARVVAYIDVVLSSIGAMQLVAGVILGLAVTSYAGAAIGDETGHVKAQDKHEITLLLISLWVLVGFSAILTCIDLWSAVMLIKATKEGAEPSKALHRAIIWRNVVIVFLMIQVASYLVSKAYVFAALAIFFRFALLYYVIKFINELKSVSGGGGTFPHPVPTAIVIKA